MLKELGEQTKQPPEFVLKASTLSPFDDCKVEQMKSFLFGWVFHHTFKEQFIDVR